jgi:hypothetical protein
MKFAERESALMRQLVAALCATIVALFLLAPGGVPLQAQTAGKTATPLTFRYDAAEEVTLSGTVARVLARGEPGMIVGAHFLLQTSAGLVDASLGRFAFEGRDALTVAAGQQVEATGVMRTVKGGQVFVVRTLEIQGEVYVIRNEHGFALSPQARGRGSKKTDGNRGTL